MNATPLILCVYGGMLAISMCQDKRIVILAELMELHNSNAICCHINHECDTCLVSQLVVCKTTPRNTDCPIIA